MEVDFEKKRAMGVLKVDGGDFLWGELKKKMVDFGWKKSGRPEEKGEGRDSERREKGNDRRRAFRDFNLGEQTGTVRTLQ